MSHGVFESRDIMLREIKSRALISRDEKFEYVVPGKGFEV